MPLYPINRHESRTFATESTAAKRADHPSLGDLPEWNLADLYPSMESPAFAADLAKAEAECAGFAADYRGRLDELA
ncbi:MAG TPA: oligoendopeptidase F, partial [Methylovirgula sp.]|nr:oligoendopeptidase F [Methylovirgula sp.]